MGAMIYIPGESIAVVIEGKQYTATSDHRNFDKIIAAAKAKDWGDIPVLVNVEHGITRYVPNAVIIDGVVYVNGNPVHNTLTNRIIVMMDEGFDIEPMMKFLVNLMSNPSESAVEELYGFLEAGQLPITDDGHFMAYKKVRHDYMDCYTGSFDNSVGSVCEMPRNECDDERNRTCSTGLHFCSFDYLQYYGHYTSRGGHTMLVKINPRDVVSIPKDYNNTKGRCCRYEVVSEVTYEGPTTEQPLPNLVYEQHEELVDNDAVDEGIVDSDDKHKWNITRYHNGYKDGRAKVQVDLQGLCPFYVEGYNDGKKHSRKKYNKIS